ncbi:hypothetical protein L226DRAFT_368104 [Lentinus tigrinus ALCF2SS1-7]|uniref:Uncharacterized protein n=1 Tax=Lentinus tigrinus ALCF2SS1-6 TaxID=1328759 RepID=A0A5C2RMN9_9APHY|nr:hypothetical protein L227DRAFT_427022 [Lentinus tigrinus ALCF2SS1-6]RPD68110.1 hypothetical protein L226DRAFT_368104 [Lentinus tigrinus ALCF2SS1-7]
MGQQIRTTITVTVDVRHVFSRDFRSDAVNYGGQSWVQPYNLNYWDVRTIPHGAPLLSPLPLPALPVEEEIGHQRTGSPDRPLSSPSFNSPAPIPQPPDHGPLWEHDESPIFRTGTPFRRYCPSRGNDLYSLPASPTHNGPGEECPAEMVEPARFSSLPPNWIYTPESPASRAERTPPLPSSPSSESAQSDSYLPDDHRYYSERLRSRSCSSEFEDLEDMMPQSRRRDSYDLPPQRPYSPPIYLLHPNGEREDIRQYSPSHLGEPFDPSYEFFPNVLRRMEY